jgi:hypothetical protein
MKAEASLRCDPQQGYILDIEGDIGLLLYVKAGGSGACDPRGSSDGSYVLTASSGAASAPGKFKVDIT